MCLARLTAAVLASQRSANASQSPLEADFYTAHSRDEVYFEKQLLSPNCLQTGALL